MENVFCGAYRVSVKIIFFLVFSLIYAALNADYRADISNGNAAFRSKNWKAAADYYKRAYAANPSPTLKKFMNAAMVNAYKEAVAKGNSFYRSGNTEEALRFYNIAYSYFPVKQVGAMIEKLGGPPPNLLPPGKKPVNDSPLKWVVIGGDAVLAIGAIASGIAASGGAAEYNELFDSTDNTTPEAYAALLEKKASVEGTQTLFGALAVLAGAALVYTAVDFFSLHLAFPVTASLKLQNTGNTPVLTINREF